MMSDEEVARQAHEDFEACREFVARMRVRELELVVRLFRLADGERYKLLGFRTWTECLAEVGIERRQRRKIEHGMKVVRELLADEHVHEAVVRENERRRAAGVPELDLVDMEISKAYLVIDPVKDRIAAGDMAAAVEWLVRALPVAHGGLSKTDLMALLIDQGYRPRRTRKYLVIDGAVEARLVESADEEEVLRRGVLVVVNPKICKGVSLVEALS